MNNRKDYPYSDEDLQGFEKNVKEKLATLRQQLKDLNDRKTNFLESTNLEKYDYEEDSQMEQETLKLNGLIENDMNQIQALEAALLRIENKTYGICTETGEYIRRERLEAMPEATTCLKAAAN
ncbi:TraR/DksA family transcriptional regulator [Flavilitoribacter nigricans]|uniref:Molecular chaperone DnaK n=1 Tax=Flavilitoribacter nigricans (strain ATCC 23147 / DSM 23189 / NBRC 102662 / NCIMB 1420 / SS-2) TaxID=1122177 RepID=A0A2D0N961_FLAN2|nr:TraR/DksA C4-type zinc finger protein [Flavilitoribacter nigricans]PHN05062.1 molecular chaperone DnaK [Flavilitoribacter nigricans DSM 23189 = NBRC 102662]